MSEYQGRRDGELRRFFVLTPGGGRSQVFTAQSPLVAFTAAAYQGGPNFVVYESFANEDGAAIPVTQSVDGMYCSYNWRLYESQQVQQAGRWFIVRSGANFYPVVATSAELAYTAYRDLVWNQGQAQDACSCFVYDGAGVCVGRTIGFRWYEAQVFRAGTNALTQQMQKYFVLTAGGKVTEVAASDTISAYDAVREQYGIRGVLPCVVFDGSQGYSTRVLALHDGQVFHTQVNEELLTWLVARLTQRQ